MQKASRDKNLPEAYELSSANMNTFQPSGTPRAGVRESPSRPLYTKTFDNQTQLHGSRRVITQYSSLIENSSSANYRFELRKPHPLSTSLTHTTTTAIAAEKRSAILAARPMMDPFNLGDKIRKIRADNQVPAIPYLLQVNTQGRLPEFPYENLKTPFERHEVQHLQYMTNLFRPDRFEVLDCKGDWKESINALAPRQGTYTPRSERAKPTTTAKAKMSFADYKRGKRTGTAEVTVESTHPGVSVKPVPKDGSNLRNGSTISPPPPATDKPPHNSNTHPTNIRASTIASNERNRDDLERHPHHDSSASSAPKPLPKPLEQKTISTSQNSISTPNKSKRPLDKDETLQSEKRTKVDDSGRFKNPHSKTTPISAPKVSTPLSTKSAGIDGTKKPTSSASTSKVTNSNGTHTTKPVSKPKPASTISKTSPTKPQKTSSMIPPPLSPTLPPNIRSPSPSAARRQGRDTPPKSPKSTKYTDALSKQQHQDEPKSPEWTPLSLPPELSPTLPSPLEREIERMDEAEIDAALAVAKERREREGSRERSASNSSEAEKKSEAHRISTIERHERSRKPGAPGVAQKLPRGKHPAKYPPASALLDDDDDEEEIPLAKVASRKETHIVKIKYNKRQAKAVKDLLRLKPMPTSEFRRLEAERLSSEKADKSDAAQRKPTVNGTDKATKPGGARKLESVNSRDKPSAPAVSRDDHRRSKEEPKSSTKDASEKATPISKPASSTPSTTGPSSASKRPRDTDENLPPSAKRLKRPTNLEVSKPSTPVTPAFKSPALAGPTSFQKVPTGTPQKKAEEHKKLNTKYNPIALSLKREMDRILQLKEQGPKPPTETDKMLGIVVGLECIVAYMTAFSHMDELMRLRNGTLRADDWQVSSKLLAFIRGQAQHPDLKALGFTLGAIICEQLDAIYATGVGSVDDMRKNAVMRLDYWQQAKKLTLEAGAKLPLGSWSTVSETTAYASTILQAFAKKKGIAWNKKIDF